jgi:hypothetical protein
MDNGQMIEWALRAVEQNPETFSKIFLKWEHGNMCRASGDLNRYPTSLNLEAEPAITLLPVHLQLSRIDPRTRQIIGEYL